jgi:hypothetical protein
MAEGIQLLDLPQAAIGEIEVGNFAYMVTPDGRPFKVDISEMVAKMQADAGCGCVLTAKLEIPSAEVLTLNTTPKLFGLTVPVGYICRVLSVDAFIDYGTTAYATNLRMGVSPVGAEFVSPTLGGDFFLSEPDFLAQTANAWGQFQPFPRTSPVSYGDWEAYVRVGDPTAGDSDITIYLTYMLIAL